MQAFITITLENKEVVSVNTADRVYTIADSQGKVLELGKLLQLPVVVPGRSLVMATTRDGDADVGRWGKVESVQYKALEA